MATELQSMRIGRIRRITVWGDFTCPWSHLAWRRSELLADEGVAIDWRTVEHDPWHHLNPTEVTDRFRALHDEVPQVLTHLLPGEPLPYTLKGHVPFTGTREIELMMAHTDRPPPRVSDSLDGASDALDAVVQRAMAKDPKARFSSGAELVAALESTMRSARLTSDSLAPLRLPSVVMERLSTRLETRTVLDGAVW